MFMIYKELEFGPTDRLVLETGENEWAINFVAR